LSAGLHDLATAREAGELPSSLGLLGPQGVDLIAKGLGRLLGRGSRLDQGVGQGLMLMPVGDRLAGQVVVPIEDWT
jgi:hypothetical protein